MTTLLRRLRHRLQHLLRSSSEVVGAWADALDPTPAAVPPDRGLPRPGRLADAPDHWLRLVAEHAPGLLADRDERVDASPSPARVPQGVVEPVGAGGAADEAAPPSAASPPAAPSSTVGESAEDLHDGTDATRRTWAPGGTEQEPHVHAPRLGPPVPGPGGAADRVPTAAAADTVPHPPQDRPGGVRSRLVPVGPSAPTRRPPRQVDVPSPRQRVGVEPFGLAADVEDIGRDVVSWTEISSSWARPAPDDVVHEVTSRSERIERAEPVVEGAPNPPAAGTAELEASAAPPTTRPRGAWPGVPAGIGPDTAGGQETANRRRTRDLLAAWRDELDDAQEELGWTASCSS